jgi:Uma2 family endonuclease
MPATALLTSEQYLALPDEFDKNGNHVKDELIGRQVVRLPIPPTIHDLVKSNIAKSLLRLEFTVLIGTGFEVSKYHTLVPDVSVIRRELLSGEDRIFRGAPEIAIEVISPDDKEVHLKTKIDAYLGNGSQSVWVVYPDARSVMVYSKDSIRELKSGQKIEDPLLPGFSTPVSAFFELT